MQSIDPSEFESLRSQCKSPEPNEEMSTPEMTFAELLRRDLGHEFPVVSGTNKADSPLVISEKRDYVAIEYAIVRHVMRSIGEEWEVAEQSLLHRDGRVIDELAVNAKDAGAADWQHRWRFYFDITLGWKATYGKAKDH